MTPAPNWFFGAAVRYEEGVMAASARQNRLSLDGYLGGVSLPNCADMGREVWLDPGTGWEGPYLVVDCSRLGDLYGIIVVRGIAVEVDHATAERWQMEDRAENIGVHLCPSDIAWEAVEYRRWWLDHLQFASAWEARPLWKDGKWWAWQPYRLNP